MKNEIEIKKKNVYFFRLRNQDMSTATPEHSTYREVTWEVTWGGEGIRPEGGRDLSH